MSEVRARLGIVEKCRRVGMQIYDGDKKRIEEKRTEKKNNEWNEILTLEHN